MKGLITALLIFLSATPFCHADLSPGTWSTSAETVLSKQGADLKIGIISAKPGEQGNLLAMMQNVTETHSGSRTFYEGELFGIDTVLTLCRVGKVASAITSTELISTHHVDLIIFIGTAGAIDEGLRRGDLVIADSLVQHDMDCSPFVPPCTVPMLRVKEFRPDPFLQSLARAASTRFLETDLTQAISPALLKQLNILQPQVHQGLIASGDQFVSSNDKRKELKSKLPELLCVEMEGAAVAQVAFEYDVPCLVVRLVSDEANRAAYDDFHMILSTVAPAYAQGIIANLYSSLLSYRADAA
jgi:adenosylhomocysteine nucleosidase